MEIKLGKKVRDKVTGFEGIAISRCEYLNGCVQYGVVQRVLPGASMPDAEYIDVQVLEIIGDGVEIDTSDIGGPQRYCPKR